MIPYMVGKLAPNSSHLTRGLVKYVPGRGNFRTVPSQNGDKHVTCPAPPIVELVTSLYRVAFVYIFLACVFCCSCSFLLSFLFVCVFSFALLGAL